MTNGREGKRKSQSSQLKDRLMSSYGGFGTLICHRWVQISWATLKIKQFSADWIRRQPFQFTELQHLHLEHLSWAGQGLCFLEQNSQTAERMVAGHFWVAPLSWLLTSGGQKWLSTRCLSALSPCASSPWGSMSKSHDMSLKELPF